jgi:hypothetical protein
MGKIISSYRPKMMTIGNSTRPAASITTKPSVTSNKPPKLTKEELEALALAKQKNTITRFSPTELRNSRNTLVNNSPNDLIPSTRTSSINPSSLFSPKNVGFAGGIAGLAALNYKLNPYLRALRKAGNSGAEAPIPVKATNKINTNVVSKSTGKVSPSSALREGWSPKLAVQDNVARNGVKPTPKVPTNNLRPTKMPGVRVGAPKITTPKTVTVTPKVTTVESPFSTNAIKNNGVRTATTQLDKQLLAQEWFNQAGEAKPVKVNNALSNKLNRYQHTNLGNIGKQNANVAFEKEVKKEAQKLIYRGNKNIPLNPKTSENIWQITARQASENKAASNAIKHQMKMAAKQAVPKHTVSGTITKSVKPSTGTSEVLPKAAVRNTSERAFAKETKSVLSKGFKTAGKYVSRNALRGLGIGMAIDLAAQPLKGSRSINEALSEEQRALSTASKEQLQKYLKVQHHPTSTKYAKDRLSKMAYGGRLPQKGVGDILLSGVSGAASGAATGSVIPGWGTIAGAIGGLGMGIWKGLKGEKAAKKEEDLRKKSEADMLAAQGKLDQQYMANYRPNNMVSMFANGGKVTLNGPTVYSRNDPAYKAYQDSLSLYKTNWDSGITVPFDDTKRQILYPKQVYYKNKTGAFIPSNKIAPIAMNLWDGEYATPIYKKPTIPITLAKSQKLQPKTIQSANTNLLQPRHTPELSTPVDKTPISTNAVWLNSNSVGKNNEGMYQIIKFDDGSSERVKIDDKLAKNLDKMQPKNSIAKYGNGGKITSNPASSDIQLGNTHLTSKFTPSSGINLVKRGVPGTWSTKGIKSLAGLNAIDFLLNVGAIVNDEIITNKSVDPKAAKRQLEYNHAREREHINSSNAKAATMYPSYMAMGGDLPGSNVPLSPRQKSYSDSLMLHNYSRDVLTNGALDYRKQELSRQALDKLGLSLEGNSKYMPSEQLDYNGNIVVKGDNQWDMNAPIKVMKGKGKVDVYKMPVGNMSNVNPMTPRGLQKKAYGGKVDGKSISGPTVYSRNDPAYKAYQDSLQLWKLAPDTGGNRLSEKEKMSTLKYLNREVHSANNLKKFYDTVNSPTADYSEKHEGARYRNVKNGLRERVFYLDNDNYIREDNLGTIPSSNNSINVQALSSEQYFSPTIAPTGWEDGPVFKKPTHPVTLAQSQKLQPKTIQSSNTNLLQSRPTPELINPIDKKLLSSRGVYINAGNNDINHQGEGMYTINTYDDGTTDKIKNNNLGRNSNYIPKSSLAKKAFGSQLNSVEIPDNNSIPINPNAEIVTNNQGGLTGSHATGVNVPAVGANGRPVALLEPKEVKMKDSKGTDWVLSHKLGMAQKYVQLNSMLEKANALYAQESNVTKRNTIARNIDKYKQMMDMLPQQQEIMKQQLGIKDAPQAGYGRELGSNPIDRYNYQSSVNPNLLNINNIGGMYSSSMKDILARRNTIPTEYPTALPQFDNNPSDAFKYQTDNSTRFKQKPVNLKFNTPLPTSLGETGNLGTGNFAEKLNKIGGTVANGKFAYGIKKGVDQLGGIGGVAKLASSFLTNALNNRDLNKQMDKVNNLKATPLKYRNLDDKVDYSAQQQGVEQSYRDAVSSTRGLSDSRTAAMMKGKFASDRVSMLNPIIENANNTSRGIRNQNVTGNNTILNANTQQQNELDRYKTEQSVGLGLAKITGRNQTLDNIYTILKEKNISDNDRTTMDLIVKTLGNNGVIDRNLAAEYERITGKKYTGKIG